MTISPDSVVLWTVGGLPITATLLYTWVVMAVLTAGAWAVTRRLSDGPALSRWQRSGTLSTPPGNTLCCF